MIAVKTILMDYLERLLGVEEMPSFYDEMEPDEDAPKLVRTKTYPVKPMTVDDAAEQMQMLGHSFFIFMNAETGKACVLYQRKDGNLGLLEPEE